MLRPSSMVCSVSPFISVVTDVTSPMTPLFVGGMANYTNTICCTPHVHRHPHPASAAHIQLSPSLPKNSAAGTVSSRCSPGARQGPLVPPSARLYLLPSSRRHASPRLISAVAKPGKTERVSPSHQTIGRLAILLSVHFISRLFEFFSVSVAIVAPALMSSAPPRSA